MKNGKKNNNKNANCLADMVLENTHQRLASNLFDPQMIKMPLIKKINQTFLLRDIVTRAPPLQYLYFWFNGFDVKL